MRILKFDIPSEKKDHAKWYDINFAIEQCKNIAHSWAAYYIGDRYKIIEYLNTLNK